MISQFILCVKCTDDYFFLYLQIIVFVLYAFILVYVITVYSDPLAGWHWPESLIKKWTENF